MYFLSLGVKGLSTFGYIFRPITTLRFVVEREAGGTAEVVHAFADADEETRAISRVAVDAVLSSGACDVTCVLKVYARHNYVTTASPDSILFTFSSFDEEHSTREVRFVK